MTPWNWTCTKVLFIDPSQVIQIVPQWNLIIWLKGVLRRTVGSDCHFNILSGSHLQNGWLWRWLLLRMQKHQSLKTVLLRTRFSWMINIISIKVCNSWVNQTISYLIQIDVTILHWSLLCCISGWNSGKRHG